MSCECDENAHDLSRGAGLALFRIVQEVVGNAAKHGTATHITVRHLARTGRYSHPDGRGFDSKRLDASGGLGLVMMRERANQLNGTFEFESAPGQGTRIRVAVPFR